MRKFKYFSISFLLILMFLLMNFGYSQKSSELAKDNEMPVYCKEYLGQLQFVKGRILELAEATPAEKYTWRPNKDVRSIAEVYRHITFGNYGFIKWTGYKVPEDANFHTDRKKWEMEVTNKKEILTAMEKSFEALENLVKELDEDDLNTTIHVFRMDMTIRNFMLVSFGHIHEHFGQSIAYVRSNDIVPPWTARAQKKAKEKAKKAE